MGERGCRVCGRPAGREVTLTSRRGRIAHPSGALSPRPTVSNIGSPRPYFKSDAKVAEATSVHNYEADLRANFRVPPITLCAGVRLGL